MEANMAGAMTVSQKHWISTTLNIEDQAWDSCSGIFIWIKKGIMQ